MTTYTLYNMLLYIKVHFLFYLILHNNFLLYIIVHNNILFYLIVFYNFFILSNFV